MHGAVGCAQDADVIQQLTNTGPFSNVQSTFYWSGTEPGPESVVLGPMFDPTAKMALAFYFSYGTRGALAQTARGPAWIVHDGDVGTSIPK